MISLGYVAPGNACSRARPPSSGCRRRFGGDGSAARDDAALGEQRDDRRDALFDTLPVGAERELRLRGRLVRRGDAGELLDLSRTRLLVEALHVALLADLERALDEHLDEVLGHERANLVAVGAVRGDERRDRHHAGLGEELRDLADPSDVLGPVLARKAEVLVEAMADVVPVEDVGADAAVPEPLLELDGDRRLPRSVVPGEPPGAAV